MLKSCFFTSVDCFHNGNTTSDFLTFTVCRCDKKLCLLPLSASNTCSPAIIWEVCCIKWLHFPYGYYGYWDIFRHSCAARQKLFVIKLWSPRRKEGEANQNSSSSQSFQPSLRADIDRQWCVCQFDQSSVSCGQTGRHPRWEHGGWGESFGQGVEDRSAFLEMDQDTERKLSGGEMDEYIDTGKMKLCKTWREKLKQSNWMGEAGRRRGGR